ncbi:MAG: hypothetical protein FJ100_06405 [Deltaproteobacteria bacterium]|nr:hypothetical protein [Deltaproteobacteria bacterium]
MRALAKLWWGALLGGCAAAQAQVPDTRLPEPDHGVPTAEAPAPSSPPGSPSPPAEDRPADKGAEELPPADIKAEAQQQDAEPIEPPADDTDDETAGADTDDDASDDAQGEPRPPSK